MIKTLFPALLAAALLTGCAASRKNSTGTAAATAPAAPSPVSAAIESKVADGSSFEKAIVITATGELAGVRAEYAWLKEHYPGYKTTSQSLNNHDKKPFDIINIVTASGEKKAVYFNISGFFGKL